MAVEFFRREQGAYLVQAGHGARAKNIRMGHKRGPLVGQAFNFGFGKELDKVLQPPRCGPGGRGRGRYSPDAAGLYRLCARFAERRPSSRSRKSTRVPLASIKILRARFSEKITVRERVVVAEYGQFHGSALLLAAPNAARVCLRRGRNGSVEIPPTP